MARKKCIAVYHKCRLQTNRNELNTQCLKERKIVNITLKRRIFSTDHFGIKMSLIYNKDDANNNNNNNNIF